MISHVKEFSLVALVVGYGLCSSLLSIINKSAITVFGYPSVLTALQYFTCVIVVLTLGRLKFLDHDPIRLSTLRKFLPAALVFYLAIFTNTCLLKHANVDTFVVFRSSTPILVAVADTVFRKQPFPRLGSLLSLVTILVGAVGYVATDSQFNVTAYSWAFSYLVVITFEMVYVKHMITHLGLNTWGLVLYNNLLALFFCPFFFLVTGEFKFSDTSAKNALLWTDPKLFVPIGLSCVFGLAISFFGFACRKSVSATAFTVIGVTNKLLTIFINVLIWDKHASGIGLAFLMLTVLGGVAYQQTSSGSRKQRQETVDIDIENRSPSSAKKIKDSGQVSKRLTPSRGPKETLQANTQGM